MRRRLLLTAGAVVLTALPVGPAFAQDLCEIDQVAVFGINSAHVSKNAAVTGDVIANGDGTTIVLDEGAEVALDRGAMVDGDVSGHTIDLDAQSQITGDAFFVELVNGGSIGGAQVNQPPPYSGLPDFQPATPGGDDVFVNPGETVVLGDEAFCAVSGTACSVDADCPLYPGNPDDLCQLAPVTAYGDIFISANGTVRFTGARSFDVASIQPVPGGGLCPAPCRSVHFDGPTDLRVGGRIDVERNAFVGPTPGSGVEASDIVIYAGGANGGAGGPLDMPFAVNIGRGSQVKANIYAPFGTIELDKGTMATGSFIALDVELQVDTKVFLDSAFSNQPPTAVGQEVLTDGAEPLEITLEGLDPEGDDLTFSIEVGPTEGTLGAIVPIMPDPVSQCSQSGAPCAVDTDCPFFAGGETCEVVQPPVTQATVVYTPNAANCVTEPESGEVTCPEDFFTFGVKDSCNALGTAVVGINGGSDEPPTGDPPGVAEVVANDRELDAVVGQQKKITLSAAAPAGVASLTFRVETLPAGTLKDSNGAAVVAGSDLPSPVLTYTAPAAAGADSFTFSARDSATTTPPCGPPSCDTAAVNIDVGNLPELAPDQSVAASLNTPVRVTLFANPGGTGNGGQGSPPESPSAAAIEVSYGDNGGPLSAYQLGRLAARQGMRVGTRAGANGPTNLTVGAGWFQFGWCDAATTPNCDQLVDLVNAVEVLESPFNFTTNGDACLRITDTLAKGDHWRVEATVDGVLDWTDFTSEVEQSQVGTTSSPDVAFGDATYSHGQFDLAGGDYSVKLTTIPPDSFAFGTAAYIRVDDGPCLDVVWAVTSLPTNGTLTNLDGSAVQLNAVYLSQPTLVYTPGLNYSGPDEFEYQVTQNGTLGINTVTDTAIVGLLVGANDNCIVVGREPGCAPDSQSFAPPAPPAESAEPDLGPRQGLTLAVEGDGGTISTAPLKLANGRVLAGTACSNDSGECHKAYPAGAEVTLYARPNGEHYEFLGWGGNCRGTEPILTVVLDAATQCTALFGRKPGS